MSKLFGCRNEPPIETFVTEANAIEFLANPADLLRSRVDDGLHIAKFYDPDFRHV